MNREIIMGIDTSNYTTSVALMYSDGELIANLKSPLHVKEGDCGLRQSEAVFSHIKNIPELMKNVKAILNGEQPSAIGVSTRPRNVEGSYMPCFLSGAAVAEGISASLGIPLFRFSHQCGHIMAAIYSSGAYSLLDEEFCAFHVSGGTTEVLRVKYLQNSFSAELVGGTLDLNAGQVIDRVGVHLGLPFPAGKYIEELAYTNTKKIPQKKPKATGLNVNLSGLENLAKKLYSESGDKALVSAFVLNYIEKALVLLCSQYYEKYGKTKYLFAGGVMSNSILRKKLESNFESYFAEPLLSADNAVGIAELTRRVYIGEKV